MSETDLKITRKQIVYAFCVMLVVVSLIVTNVTASKMYEIDLFGLSVWVPVGTSLFCLSFLATDVISEIWGRSHAILVAVMGTIARVVTASFFGIAILIPGVESWANQEAYELILGASSRILIAGIVAYLVTGVIDAYVYHYFRERHRGKNLMFLRNNISTFSAQSVGAIIFSTVAFYGIIPNDKLLIIIAGNMMIKWVMAIIDTPFVYLLRNFALNRPLFDLKG